jgi:hypothetical protein
VSLDRVALKEKVVAAPEILSVIRDQPHISDLVSAVGGATALVTYVCIIIL